MKRNWSGRDSRMWRVVVLLMSFAMILAACGGSDDEGSATTAAGGDTETTASSGETKTINVAIVGNPQMEDIASLTPQLFTAETGINVEYTILEEQTLREIVTRDVGASGQQFDVVMIGMYEAPQFGENGWLYDLDKWAVDDAAYNKSDLIDAVVSGLSTDNGYLGLTLLCGVVVLDVSQGHPRRGRPDHAGCSELG